MELLPSIFNRTISARPYESSERAKLQLQLHGYRLPLIVVSPFTKKNYVSHTPADFTAILRFIEARFGLIP